MTTPFEYWSSGLGLGHVTPQSLAKPEGPAFEATLLSLLGNADVVEFGCGRGRLAELLSPARYVGLDICAQAIADARAAHPDHAFRQIDNAEPINEGQILLAHTVMLHIPDDDLGATIDRFLQPRVIVSEILGRRHRTPGFPPVFNREVSEYRSAFAKAGLRYIRRIDVPYEYYADEFMSFLEFKR